MEACSGAKRLGWVVIACLACAFSYSIGFQFGWSEATVRADDRLINMTESLEGVIDNVRAEVTRGGEAQAAGDAGISGW